MDSWLLSNENYLVRPSTGEYQIVRIRDMPKENHGDNLKEV